VRTPVYTGAHGRVLFRRESCRRIPLFVLTLFTSTQSFAAAEPRASAEPQPSAAPESAAPESAAPESAAPESTGSREPGHITPPSLIHFEQAALPSNVILTEATSVPLELTIGLQGEVTNVRVRMPNDPVLDAEATKAATKFVFSPAERTKQDGSTEVIPVVIQFEYWFQPPPPVVTAPTDSSAPASNTPAPTDASTGSSS
jgi:TonB family protein